VAGVRQPLSATPLPATSVTILPWDTNAGRLFVGGATVSAATVKGLRPGSVLGIAADPPLVRGVDLATIYLDAEYAADGADLYYVEI
jgi:hypothetical protein